MCVIVTCIGSLACLSNVRCWACCVLAMSIINESRALLVSSMHTAVLVLVSSMSKIRSVGGALCLLRSMLKSGRRARGGA